MLGFCPNKKFKSTKEQSQSDWEILEEKVGYDQAMKYFMENDDNLPSIEFINSLKSKQQQISEKLDAESIKTTYNKQEEKYHTVLPNEPDHIVQNRVSDDIKRMDKKRNFAERSEKEKKNDDIKRRSGNRIHNILENIGIRFVQGLNKEPQIPINEYSLGPVVYKRLEQYFNDTVSQFKPGTIFKIEQIIYDPKLDKAGRIDLLAIEPDGTGNIIDWKLIDFFGKESVPFYKAENFNVQIEIYKEILKKNYGISKFRLKRVMPISGKFALDKGNLYLKSLEIGKKDYNLNADILNPLPVMGLKGTEFESTGDDKIDNLIKKLLSNLKIITDKTETTTGNKELRIQRIESLTKTIKSLQLKKDLELFLENGKSELNYITNKKPSNLTEEELNYYKKFVEFYVNIQSKDLVDDINKTKYQDDLDRLSGSASRIYADINAEILNRVEETALNQGQDHVFDAYPQTGLLGRLFRSASQNNHPLIRTLYLTVQKQKDKVLKEMNILKDKIVKSEENLKTWGKSKGLSGLDVFKPLLQFRDGKWNGNMIDKYSPEYYKAKKQATETKDIKWFQENVKFDQQKYDRNLKSRIENWKEVLKAHPKSKPLETRIKEYEEQNNVIKHPKAYLTTKYYYLKPIDQWRSNEWKYIHQAGNEPLKEFYELFTELITEYEDYVPKDQKGRFIPNITQNLIEQMMNNGLFSIKGMKDNIIDSISVKSDVNIGMVDDFGNMIRQVPIYYKDKIDPSIKSQDLGKSLLLFADMALTAKYMSEIEDSALLLEDAMNQHPTLLTDATGSPVKNKITGSIATLLNSKDDIELFTSYLNFYIYGIKQTSKDKVIGTTEDETKISGLKTFGKLLQFYSAKALSLNLASSVANGIGGNANAFIEGSKGRLFSKTDYIKAMGLLSKRDNNAIMALEYFDIFSENTSHKKAQNLSVSKTLRTFTFDKFYLLQTIGDYSVEASTLLAMLQSHTIKDGKIIKIKDKDNQKSLLELSEIKNDKFSINGITDEEFGKFRRKVKYLYTTMKGNNNHDDINQIKLSILGQVLMQFRNWIPRMADERFGELRYTGDLELWEEGRYKALWTHLINKRILPNLLTLMTSNGIFGLGAGLIGKTSLQEAARREYTLMKAKNPDLKITEEEYIDLYTQNIKATMMELQMILAVIGLVALVKPGDNDDKKDPYTKTFLKLLGRSAQELSFWINPDSTQSLLKTPIPILGMFQDIYNLLKTTLSWGFGEIIQDEDIEKLRRKEVKIVAKQFPLLRGAEYIYSTAKE